MKLLVLSDSHAARRFMKDAIEKLKPDAVIHLGDFYDDAQVLAQDYPYLVFHTVPGNCDQFRVCRDVAQTLCYSVGGVRLYMTHGHLHGVKSGTHRLALDGRKAGAQAVLYGHTHAPDCRKEDDLWIFNPGSCGHAGGTVGIIETNNGQIISCQIIKLWELEALT